MSKTEEITYSSNTLDKVKKTLAICLKVKRMTNAKGWKKASTTQQKEERLEGVKEVPVEDLKKADHAMRVIAMRYTANMAKNLNNRKLCPVFENGRLENGTQLT